MIFQLAEELVQGRRFTHSPSSSESPLSSSEIGDALPNSHGSSHSDSSGDGGSVVQRVEERVNIRSSSSDSADIQNEVSSFDHNKVL